MKYQIKNFDKIDSTNSHALKHASELENFTIISAKQQTAGKGRKGRQWVSPPGDNLYFTLLIKDPEIEIKQLSSLPQIMALAVNNMLKQCGIKNSWIKWPNDVYVNHNKICGILCESRLQGSTLSALAIGVGVNINMSAETLDAIDTPATSMIIESKDTKPYIADEILHFILMKFLDGYQLYINEETRAQIIEQWRESSQLIGRQVILQNGDKKIFGTAVDFNEDGEIIIQTENGFETFSYGDLSLRLV
jgi:BirA family transcriptional regulator, biotin operon repressor / biotin---[acetyl-CoA-carboxylase] ligase